MDGLDISRGDFVVISTRYGRDMARILGPVRDRKGVEPDNVRLINRIADDEDIARREEFEKKEEAAYHICREKISRLKLAMKLVSAHYMLDEQKVMFFFTAENRIDFRELVKELVSHFKMRIELRQIGVRDESRVVGGVAVCGRQFCCHGLTDRLKPVSIKMAKEQNLSLNSLKISGPCGRLLCCLAFEHEHYSAERKLMPHEGSRIMFEGYQYKVSEVNIFTRKIHLYGPEGRRMNVPVSRLTRKEGGGWNILPEEDEV
jgi:cell fate regulator YaaT (PSP1 superfamily)